MTSSSTASSTTNLNKLEQAVHKSETFLTTATFVTDKNIEVTMTINMDYYNMSGYHYPPDLHSFSGSNVIEGRLPLAPQFPGSLPSKSFSQVITELASRFPGAKLDLASVTVRGRRCPIKGKELKFLTIRAWCEARGLPVPTESDIREEQQEKRKRAAMKGSELSDLLRDKEGIKKFNNILLHKKQEANLRRSQLRELDLSRVDLKNLDLMSSVFDGSRIVDAELNQADLRKSSFVGCTMERVNCSQAKLKEASFKDAVIRGSRFVNSDLRSVDLKGARLEDVEFTHADFRGTNLSNATIVDARFYNALYDADTKFPDDFFEICQFSWSGKGRDPREVKKQQEQLQSIRAPEKPLEIADFLERLKENVDSARLKKSLSMLKKDSFKLFSKISDSSITGVVKSQTDPNLVYSCKLTDQGEFSCCTQNLFSCGGLRGELCKHILVLLIGLAKASEIDPGVADTWARRSKMQSPSLDKDEMSETFLNYKGAEAGEVDWRPTETMPEDFYAF